MRASLESDMSDLIYDDMSDAEIRYHLQLAPDEVVSNIGTSTLLAAWNAAIYVAQIDDNRLNEAMRQSHYLEVTQRILEEHGGLWFRDECFTVSRAPSS